MPSLVATTGQSVDLPFKHIAIGSDPSCDIPMRADLGIGFRHVLLQVTPQGTWLQAPDVNQPVMVNGGRVASAPLQDGDVLTIGSVNLMFRSSPPATPSVAAPFPSSAPAPAATLRSGPVAGTSNGQRPAPPMGIRPLAAVAAASVPPPQPVAAAVAHGSQAGANWALAIGLLWMVIATSVLAVLYPGLKAQVPLEKVRYLDVPLISSQYVTGSLWKAGHTLLKGADDASFTLPPDTNLDLTGMKLPVSTRIGVDIDSYKPGGAPAGVITLDVNGKPWRTLRRHNEIKAHADEIELAILLVLIVGALPIVIWGFNQRETGVAQ